MENVSAYSKCHFMGTKAAIVPFGMNKPYIYINADQLEQYGLYRNILSLRIRPMWHVVIYDEENFCGQGIDLFGDQPNLIELFKQYKFKGIASILARRFGNDEHFGNLGCDFGTREILFVILILLVCFVIYQHYRK
jgi:hypothetical protein